MFGRSVTLQLGNEAGAGKSFTGLRVRFRVEMTRESTPDKATIELYNPAPDSIALVQQPLSVVRLLVGYEDSIPQQVFQGNPIPLGVHDTKTGPTRILKIEAQDGQRALSSKRINLSLATATTLGAVLTQVTTALGLPQGTVLPGDLASRRLTQGAVLVGSCADVLTRLCNSAGLEWFVRDGALQIVTAGGTTGEIVPVFSSISGNLIGSPIRTKEGIEVKALISPTLRPGKMFSVASLDYNGLCICDSLVFDGDSGWDVPYYVTAKGHAA
jgi:hypothetical protein